MVLSLLAPVTIPLGVVLLIHAWAIPELYAARGAQVVKRRDAAGRRAERVALGLLGDLLDHDARELHGRTGLALERGTLGVWLVGEAGALLVRPGGQRVHCYCVKVTEPGLPAADRTAHLLLALREDECGFTTVANLAFAGATWRLRRRVAAPVREALAEAVREASPRSGRLARMRTEVEPRHPRRHVPILRRALAGIVLVVVAALVIKLMIGFVMAIFWTVVAVGAVVAVLWALKTLIW